MPGTGCRHRLRCGCSAQSLFTTASRCESRTPAPWRRLDKSGQAGREARAALKLLAARGLTAEVVDELRALTAIVGAPFYDKESARMPELPDTTPDIEEAIGELSAWYLEWGQVVRTQIVDGRVLRQAGFLSGDRRTKPTRGKSAEATGRS